ncbi:MAG TPA: LUD domain-containing protein [Candidatus Saccharimonadales bacterium]|nr:LUD domain-containing protein [Candidatus Saccharimonadales bacterium]
MNNKWTEMPTDETLQKTIDALKKNNFQAEIVESGEAARQRVFELIPQGSEVMTMTSVTLETLGIAKEINESGKYTAIRTQLMKMDPKTQHKEMNKLASAPDFAIGSAHAVTQDGHVVIASRSGSQLPAYVYGAGKVVWVIGAQKVVENNDAAVKRIYEYVLERESERVQKAYGLSHSDVDKLLFYNADQNPERIHLLLVKELLGF